VLFKRNPQLPQAALDFSAYIPERARDFVGHKWVFAEINHWLARTLPPDEAVA
jgi:hypothetical protein